MQTKSENLHLIDQIRQKEHYALKTDGMSMFPLLYPGDVVHFKKMQLEQVEVNDIVVVEEDGRLFTHRVVYKGSDYLVTGGDNNLASDGRIDETQLLGRMTKVERDGQEIVSDNLYLIQSTYYFAEIVKIKAAFEKAGIDFVFLKGLPVHLYYEKRHPKRIYLDCDVMIKRSDYLKAHEILHDHGCQRHNQDLSTIQSRLKDKEVEVTYTKEVNDFPVVFDLHLEPVFMMTQLGTLNALYSQTKLDQLTDRFLEGRRHVCVRSNRFPILAPADLIVYLALHFFHHNFRGMFRLRFMARVYEIESSGASNQLDEAIQDVIKEFDLANFVYPVFGVLRHYCNLEITAVPARYQETVQGLIKDDRIFDRQTRVSSGIERFFNLYRTSPHYWLRKSLVFFYPSVAYMAVWLGVYVLRRFIYSSIARLSSSRARSG